MKKSRKKIITWVLLSGLIILVTGGFVGYKMYTKPHRNVEHAKAITATATQLATAFENNEATANSIYLDKILEVTGNISDLSQNQKGETIITLNGTDMSTVRGTLEAVGKTELKAGATITLKGICTGYLTDVVLVRCVIQ